MHQRSCSLLGQGERSILLRQIHACLRYRPLLPGGLNLEGGRGPCDSSLSGRTGANDKPMPLIGLNRSVRDAPAIAREVASKVASRAFFLSLKCQQREQTCSRRTRYGAQTQPDHCSPLNQSFCNCLTSRSTTRHSLCENATYCRTGCGRASERVYPHLIPHSIGSDRSSLPGRSPCRLPP